MASGIDANTLAKFKDWFHCYTKDYRNGDETLVQNIDLKIEHTHKVCGAITGLSDDLNFSDVEKNLAESIALFHDIGRFEQYKQYRTFADARSVNHAELGVQVLRESGILNGLESSTQNIIYKSVQYHNRKVLPEDDSTEVLYFTRMVRDADKFDIYRVVTDYYEAKLRNEVNETIELDLPDLPEISDFVIKDLKKRQPVDMKHLKTFNDFKMIQIGWIYNINFLWTLIEIEACDYIHNIKEVLPDIPAVNEIVSDVHQYIQEKKKIGLKIIHG